MSTIDVRVFHDTPQPDVASCHNRVLNRYVVKIKSQLLSNIRAELARSCKTQSDVADVIGVTRQAVSRRMRGDVPFRVDEIEKLALMLGLSASDLMHDEVDA